jgi:hypothetical protein
MDGAQEEYGARGGRGKEESEVQRACLSEEEQLRRLIARSNYEIQLLSLSEKGHPDTSLSSLPPPPTHTAVDEASEAHLLARVKANVDKTAWQLMHSIVDINSRIEEAKRRVAEEEELLEQVAACEAILSQHVEDLKEELTDQGGPARFSRFLLSLH